MEAGLPFVHAVCVAAIAFHCGIRCHITTLLEKKLLSFVAGILLHEREFRVPNGGGNNINRMNVRGVGSEYACEILKKSYILRNGYVTSVLCEGHTLTRGCSWLFVCYCGTCNSCGASVKAVQKADGFQFYAVKLILNKNDERNVQCNQDWG